MNHKLGIDQGEWTRLKQKLLAAKASARHPVSLSLIHGSDSGTSVDTIDVKLDIDLRIIHLDVGQGEATLIVLSCERELCKQLGESSCLMSILIDGGLQNKGSGLVVRALRLSDVNHLDAAVISHFDADHYEGVLRVIQEGNIAAAQGDVREKVSDLSKIATDASVERAGKQSELDTARRKFAWHFRSDSDSKIEPEGYNDPDFNFDDANHWSAVTTERVFIRSDDLNSHPKTSEVVEACTEHGATNVVIQIDDVLEPDCDAVGGKFAMTCLAVNSGNATVRNDTSGDDENANSIAWLITFGKYRYYTAGDLPTKFEDPLAKKIGAGGALTAFKCGHHGSSTCTSAKFLKRTKPRIAFASAGKHKKFRHPNGETLVRLMQSKATRAIYVTNCYAPQPGIYKDYLTLMHKSLRAELVSARSEVKGWLLPEVTQAHIDAESVASKKRYGEDCMKMSRGWKKLKNTLRRCRDSMGTEFNEALTDATLTTASDALGALEHWGKKYQRIAIALEQKIRIGGVEFEFNLKTDSDGYKAAKASLSEASRVAAEIIRARGVIASEVASRMDIAVAGTRDCMGTVQMLMRADDCDKDDRDFFVGYERGGWKAYRYPESGDGVESPVQLPSRDLLERLSLRQVSDVSLPEPLTPKKYSNYLGELATFQTKHAQQFPESYSRGLVANRQPVVAQSGPSRPISRHDDEERKYGETSGDLVDNAETAEMKHDVADIVDQVGEEQKNDRANEVVPMEIDPPNDKVNIAGHKRKGAPVSESAGSDTNAKEPDLTKTKFDLD